MSQKDIIPSPGYAGAADANQRVPLQRCAEGAAGTTSPKDAHQGTAKQWQWTMNISSELFPPSKR